MPATERSLNCYVVSYMREGSSVLRMGGKDYRADKGDVIIIPPQTPHEHYKDTDELSCFMWWHFTWTISDTVEILSIYDLPVLFHIEDDSRFQDVFSQYLKHAGSTGSVASFVMAEAKAIELVGVLLEMVLDSSEEQLCRSRGNAFVSMLSDIIEHPSVYSNLNLLSDKYHLHPTYISNKFRKMFDISPIRLAQKICLKQAKQMLSYDSLSITEIASRLGYGELGNFSRFFKTKTGMSPQQFRTETTRSYRELADTTVFNMRV
jgi:AraC-like DNA-binding protein